MTEPDPSPAREKHMLTLDRLTPFTPKLAKDVRHRIIGFDSRDIRARPFNLLRTTFAKRIKEAGAKLIGVTSATPAAGKSFVSMNLAASLARVLEEPVFLVDLDLRRASLASEIGLEAERGIEAVLEGEITDIAAVGHRVEGTRLGLFPARHRSQQTAELLAGESYHRMIDIFREESEAAVILFDLPPAFANDDAMIILERLDGYVLVVDAGKTTAGQVRDVLAMLDPAPCLGSILNRYQGGLADTYGYGYGGPNYIKYYSES